MSVVGFVNMVANLGHKSVAVPGVLESKPDTYGEGVHIRRAFVPVGFAAFATLPLSLGAHYLGFPATVAPLAAALSFLIIGHGGSSGFSGRGSALAMVVFVALAGLLEAGIVVLAHDPQRAPLSLLATILLVVTPYARLRRESMRRLADARHQAEIQTKLLRSVIDAPIAVVDRTGRLHAATDSFYEEPSRGWPTDELLDRTHVLDRPRLLEALHHSAVARHPACLDVRLDRSPSDDACIFETVRISLAPMAQHGLARLMLATTSPCDADDQADRFDGDEDLAGGPPPPPSGVTFPLQGAGA